ncbi:hypothetical protein BUALT_Bualt04G0088100 [Buddleja alternifolia]|uniref:RING-type E3 ubiquitin transferase n=1 Tax=Buddleja alternifolia TaxID=168488 RepID=A0AAV6XPF8_9LAMI|nr:hypothetical protein BUALT_Bualt04G0088100 [Buddleja alternifolia]
MARFSVGGDEDGNEERERPSCNNTPLSKKPRTSNTNSYTAGRPNAAAAASTSNSGDRAAGSITGNPNSTVAAPSESQLCPDEESDTSGANSSSSSDEEEERSGDEVQPNEARLNLSPDGNDDHSHRCEEPEELSGPISMTLTDPDVLDCPVCFDPLSSPVYQCENGHISCASCCTVMKNKCPNCCMPIGYNRCRAIEKVLEAVRIACRNKPYGCMETLNYSEKLAHEKTCNNAPCSCPHPGCDYVGMSKCLYAHFAMLHRNSSKQFIFGSYVSISLDNAQKHMFLQEKNESILFIINRSTESRGSFVNVICVAPGKRRYLYYLSARDGESSVRLKTSAECIPKWTAHPPAKKVLMVPSDFIRVSGQLNLDLIIWGDC